jgi:hypothetical protein
MLEEAQLLSDELFDLQDVREGIITAIPLLSATSTFHRNYFLPMSQSPLPHENAGKLVT